MPPVRDGRPDGRFRKVGLDSQVRSPKQTLGIANMEALPAHAGRPLCHLPGTHKHMAMYRRADAGPPGRRGLSCPGLCLRRQLLRAMFKARLKRKTPACPIEVLRSVTQSRDGLAVVAQGTPGRCRRRGVGRAGPLAHGAAGPCCTRRGKPQSKRSHSCECSWLQTPCSAPPSLTRGLTR